LNKDAFLGRIDEVARELQVLSGRGLHEAGRHLAAIHLNGLGGGVAGDERGRVGVAGILDAVPGGQEIGGHGGVVDDQAVISLRAEAGAGLVRAAGQDMLRSPLRIAEDHELVVAEMA
jgi:hypothetical protein